MGKILLIGEPMVLLTATDYGELEDVKNFDVSLAGAEVNVCIGLTRLGHQATYLTALGDDPFGKNILKRLKKEGLNTSLITIDNINKTGMMIKNKVSEGDPKIAYFRKGSAFSQIDSSIIDTINLSEYDQVHITGIACAVSPNSLKTIESLAKKAKKAGVYVSFDPNLRPQLWSSKEEMIQTLNHIAKYSDMILPGIGEAKILTGIDKPQEIASFYQNQGVSEVVVKDGSHGAYLYTKKDSYFQPGFKIEKVIDTVGAGDGFAVGIISSRLEKKSEDEMLQRANAIGAIQVTVVGDNEGLPTKEELETFIESHKRSH